MKEIKEGEQQVTEHAEEEAPKDVLNAEKVPEFVVRLEGSDEFLKARTKGLPEENVVGTHFTEEGMNRRLDIYNKNNISEGGVSVLSTFFNENNIDILHVNVEALPNEEIFNTIKIFVERV